MYFCILTIVNPIVYVSICGDVKLNYGISCRYGLPCEEMYTNADYPSLLCAAVRHKCVWAVQMLVNLGASPLVCCGQDGFPPITWLVVFQMHNFDDIKLEQELYGEIIL